MRRAVVAFVLAASLPSGARAQLQPVPDMTLALRAPGGTVLDWYPAASGFRVTGGFRDAPEPDHNSRRPRPGTLAPYLGLGWQGSVLGDRVQIGLDFGAFYHGHPDVRIVDRGPALVGDDGPAARGGDHAFPLAPTFSLTFTYRF